MKTEQEIRARIKQARLSIDEEDENGGTGGDDWMEATTIQRTLLWVLGEE